MIACLPRTQIRPSPLNPRKTVSPASLAELAASVRSQGILQPLLVRPAGGGYEAVCGHRRLRAAELAGIDQVPCVVREMTDEQAIVAALAGNDQREEVDPLEEAEAYRRLVGIGNDVEAIAVKIGREPQYVAERLHLTHLIPALQADLRGGKLPPKHAYLLARLPARDQQALLSARGGDDALYDAQDRPVPVPVLRQVINTQFVGVLSDALWDKADANLVPSAGPCTACPKRVGQNPTLLSVLVEEPVEKQPRGRDWCTDRGCYAAKREAFVGLQLDRVRRAGQEPLSVTTEYWTGDPAVVAASRYEVVETPGRAKGDVRQAVVVAGQGVGRVLTVRLHGDAPVAPAAGEPPADEARRKERAERAAGVAAIRLAAEAARVATADIRLAASPLAVVRQLAAGLIDEHPDQATVAAIAKDRQLDVKHGGPRAALVQEVMTSGFSEIVAIISGLAAVPKARRWGQTLPGTLTQSDKNFWAAVGVDRAALLKAEEKKGLGASKRHRRA